MRPPALPPKKGHLPDKLIMPDAVEGSFYAVTVTTADTTRVYRYVHRIEQGPEHVILRCKKRVYMIPNRLELEVQTLVYID